MGFGTRICSVVSEAVSSCNIFVYRIDGLMKSPQACRRQGAVVPPYVYQIRNTFGIATWFFHQAGPDYASSRNRQSSNTFAQRLTLPGRHRFMVHLYFLVSRPHIAVDQIVTQHLSCYTSRRAELLQCLLQACWKVLDCFPGHAF